MRKFIISIYVFLIFSLIGCSAPFDEQPILPDAQASIQDHSSDIIPIEEALSNLRTTMEAITGTERTRSLYTDNTLSIQDIQISGGKQATRSTEYVLPDTMVYVVNFTDEKGFAVLGALRSLEPVYAITESGSFDAEKLNAAIGQAQRQALESQPKQIDDSKAFDPIGVDYVYTLLANALVAPRISGPTSEIISVSYGPLDITKTVGPLVQTKWGQGYPFNMYKDLCPELADDEINKGRYPAGCGMVAMAQIMNYTRIPAKAPAQNLYYWAAFQNISTYKNYTLFKPTSYPANVNANLQAQTKELAEVLDYMGDLFGAYPYGTDTYVTPGNVFDALKRLDPYFLYAKLEEINKIGMDPIYQSIDDNKPVYISGRSAQNTGHAWVADGYSEGSRKVYTKLRWEPGGYTSTQITTEKVKLLHFNWGYQGESDGYFFEGIFDMMDREYRDPIDTDYHAYENLGNYYIRTNVIIY